MIKCAYNPTKSSGCFVWMDKMKAVVHYMSCWAGKRVSFVLLASYAEVDTALISAISTCLYRCISAIEDNNYLPCFCLFFNLMVGKQDRLIIISQNFEQLSKGQVCPYFRIKFRERTVSLVCVLCTQRWLWLGGSIHVMHSRVSIGPAPGKSIDVYTVQYMSFSITKKDNIEI